MNTWTVFLILSTACVTFYDAAGTETRGTCADQVCPLVCKPICSYIPVDYQVTNSSTGTSSLTTSQPDPYSLCEPICETLCKKILRKVGITSESDGVEPLAEKFNIELKIENHTPEDLLIANEHLEFGKWTKYPSCKETSSPGGLVIPPNGTVQLKSCGREYATSGTEGGFDIQVKAGSKPVANIYFDVPWRVGSEDKFQCKPYASSPYICAETALFNLQKSVICK